MMNRRQFVCAGAAAAALSARIPAVLAASDQALRWLFVKAAPGPF